MSRKHVSKVQYKYMSIDQNLESNTYTNIILERVSKGAPDNNLQMLGKMAVRSGKVVRNIKHPEKSKSKGE